jgi:AbrB family looped-hinge helix DNA binding protein
MNKSLFDDFLCCGATKVGERGQVVIPIEIRKKMKIKPGDKLFVFSKFNEVVGLIKPEHFDDILTELTKTLQKLKHNN